MKIRTAKSKLFSKATVYYVPSATGISPHDEHIVVFVNQTAFCDCKDFMTRRLPLLGTSAFTNCKHGLAVIRMLNEQLIDVPTIKKSLTKKYGVFTGSYLGDRRSMDIPQEFGNKKAASEAIRQYETLNGKLGRVARVL